MKKERERIQYVLVDRGYGPSENWNCARVIKTGESKDLFTGEPKEQLLVELPGGERVWVSHWRGAK